MHLGAAQPHEQPALAASQGLVLCVPGCGPRGTSVPAGQAGCPALAAGRWAASMTR